MYCIIIYLRFYDAEANNEDQDKSSNGTYYSADYPQLVTIAICVLKYRSFFLLLLCTILERKGINQNINQLII